MRVPPRRLNTAVATLFMMGATGFALGSTHVYASAVGARLDALTFFVASLFFTSASFGQLAQASSPTMLPTGTPHDDRPQPLRVLAWRPRDRDWLAAATQFPGTLFFNVTTAMGLVRGLSPEQYDRVVWRPDFYGSTLFLVSSACAILAAGPFLAWRPASAAWRIAWLNMVGSIAFMVSAVGSYVLPDTGAAVNLTWADRGTLVGAVCFFVGALLMLPAWKAAAAQKA